MLADVSPNPATRDAREIVRNTWRKWFGDTKQAGEFEAFWQEAVRSGVVKGTAAAASKGSASGKIDLPPVLANPSGDQYEINFRADAAIYDGRYANNGWLMELPRPVTRMTWENAAYVGMETAKKLQAYKDARWTAGEHGRMEVSVVELEFKGRKIKLPVWGLPGHAENVITVHLGFGRDRAGRVGNPDPSLSTKTVIGNGNNDDRNAEGKLSR
ncbi:MAG: hypothetical protein JF610_14050, partial [Acidobacteria bacterium]|nr:hypothetical protein [Acidobacteriota bacterium]